MFAEAPNPFALTALLLCLATPVTADNLGLRFADVSIDTERRGSVTGDFAVSAAHGLQLDLGVISYGDEFLGQLDAHLYMMPTQAAKYGLYASLADMDGREATIASVGVEAMFALSEATEVQGRAGIGMAMPRNMEFITATLGANHAVNPELAVFGDVTITEVDEAALRAVASAARIGISYQPDGRPWQISAAVVRDGVSGRDSAAFETRVELGLTLRLGGSAPRGLAAQKFASPQPFDPLLRRGMF